MMLASDTSEVNHEVDVGETFLMYFADKEFDYIFPKGCLKGNSCLKGMVNLFLTFLSCK